MIWLLEFRISILGVGTKSLLSSRFIDSILDESKIKSNAEPSFKFVGIKFSSPSSSYLIFGPKLEILNPNLHNPLKFS